jgi:hypothetical protein
MPRAWRGDSIFGDGPRVARDREWLAQWKARIGFLRRAGRLTALHAEIALVLARRLGQDGRLDPSHATIAKDAKAGCRTVQRALARLADLGLLRWVRRLVRDGSICSQTSNAYSLTMPGVVAPEPMRLGDRQVGRATLKEVFSSAAQAMKEAVNDALTALAAVRTRREATLAARWREARA